jgi:peptidoglycan hydrolase-like protein with peptidoglycan-binding domain
VALRGRALIVCFAIAAAAASTANAGTKAAGLQVALRARGLYSGPVDGIYGPMSARALRRFQRRAHLQVDGRAGPDTRRALGPLGGPSFGSRTIRRGSLGWDVSIMQFLLSQRGTEVPINGYFGEKTERKLRAFQRSHRLVVDGIAGPKTLRRLVATRHKRSLDETEDTSVQRVRALIDRWSAHYSVDGNLMRALAWMESGYQADVTSPVGAWGVMQVIPGTWSYVETQLIGSRVPRTLSGNIRVGTALMRELLREFSGREGRALAAWYQGSTSLRRRGAYRETRRFVANVIALKARTV